MTDTLKNKTERLVNNDSLLNEFLTHSKDIFVRLDNDYRIVYLSNSFEKITQQKARRWIGLAAENLSEQLSQQFIDHHVQHPDKMRNSNGNGNGSQSIF